MRVLKTKEIEQVSGASFSDIWDAAKKGAAKAHDLGVGGTVGTVIGGAVGAAVGLISSLF
jgi:hypothetical protein